MIRNREMLQQKYNRGGSNGLAAGSRFLGGPKVMCSILSPCLL